MDIKCKALFKATSYYFKIHWILDKPACSVDLQFIYQASKLQTVNISCSVNANPSDTLEFAWSFNNSANIMDIPVTFDFIKLILHIFLAEIRHPGLWSVKCSQLHTKNRTWFWNSYLYCIQFSWEGLSVFLHHSSNWASWSSIWLSCEQCYLFIFQGQSCKLWGWYEM